MHLSIAGTEFGFFNVVIIKPKGYVCCLYCTWPFQWELHKSLSDKISFRRLRANCMQTELNCRHWKLVLSPFLLRPVFTSFPSQVQEFFASLHYPHLSLVSSFSVFFSCSLVASLIQKDCDILKCTIIHFLWKAWPQSASFFASKRQG